VLHHLERRPTCSPSKDVRCVSAWVSTAWNHVSNTYAQLKFGTSSCRSQNM